jgi:hypothetical protein
VVALVHHLEQLGVFVNHSRRSNRRGRRTWFVFWCALNVNVSLRGLLLRRESCAVVVVVDRLETHAHVKPERREQMSTRELRRDFFSNFSDESFFLLGELPKFVLVTKEGSEPTRASVSRDGKLQFTCDGNKTQVRLLKACRENAPEKKGYLVMCDFERLAPGAVDLDGAVRVI